MLGNKSDVEHPDCERAKDLAGKYEVQYGECSAKEGEGVVDVFNKLTNNLAKKIGGAVVGEGELLKPQVNIREGKKKCCG